MNIVTNGSVLLAGKSLLLVACIAFTSTTSIAQPNPQPQSNSERDARTLGASVQNSVLLPVQDGWHTWTVDAVENAPNWCCITWSNHEVTESGCALDGGSYSYGISTDDAIKVTDLIRVYAQIENGKTKRLRAFGEQCRVSSKDPVTDHGKPGTAASLEWLSAQLNGDRHLTGQSLSVIAVHESDRAQSLLVDATRPDRVLTTRKDAVFWMGQVRANQSESVLTRIMRKDSNAELREHAIFSISQSSLNSRIDLIDGAARKDRSPKVRGQAWFWMAQTKDADAERRIRAGMQSESDRAVLDQAVFALSQLPSGSGVKALIDVIEDEHFDRELRKKALFWLAQSSSEQALNYLADVLNR